MRFLFRAANVEKFPGSPIRSSKEFRNYVRGQKTEAQTKLPASSKKSYTALPNHAQHNIQEV
jgi:hypothetical protein